MEAAYDTLYRAAWDQNYASPAYFHLAQISTKRKKVDQALNEINRSLDYNSSNLPAKNLKTSILRKLNRTSEAAAEAADVLEKDALNAYALHENILLGLHGHDILTNLLQANPESYLELAINYLNSGFENEGVAVLELAVSSGLGRLENYPTVHYYLGHLFKQVGDQAKSKKHFERAGQLSLDYCFPYRFESIAVFREALEIDPSDAHAAYYLGNLLYEKQPKVAIAYWEQAVKIKPTLARAHRNLGWGNNHTLGDLTNAIASYEKAIGHDPFDPKFYFELDKLYEKNGTDVKHRYRILSEHHEIVKQRPDALLQEIKAMLLNRKSKQAIEYLLNHFFPRQEGVDNLHDIYVDACLSEGFAKIQENKSEEAMQYFAMADQYPENHQIGRSTEADKDAQVFYFQGLGYEKLGQKVEATESFQKVTSLDINEAEYKFYQSLAYQKLGNKSHAYILADEIQEESKELLNKRDKIDFFSKFGEGQSDNEREAKALYLQALSDLIREKRDEANENLRKVIELNPSNLWARINLREI